MIDRFHDKRKAGARRVLLVAATGAGKTVIGGKVVSDAVARDERVLFLVHREELLQQASAKLYAAGIDHGIIKAGHPLRLGERVQIASIQTLWFRAYRGSAIEPPRAHLIVVDEAHHARSRTWAKIIDSYPAATVLGLTATPCRGDGRGLGNIFDAMVECVGVGDLVEMGYLVPTRVYAPSRPDLTGVQVRRGDYVETQLAGAMDRPKLVGDIVEHWHKLADRRPTVVFATNVSHSIHVRDEFLRSGVLAEHVDGTTPLEDRNRILARLAAGDVEVVTNCMVLTEGWDCPSVSCLVLARPTRHMGLYRQMAGRVLRPAPGKTDALILDHAGAVFEHGLPEEPVVWTLDEDRRAENAAQASRAAGTMPTLTTCPECSAVRMSGQPCGACGWKPKPKTKSVDVADGDLARVRRDMTVEGIDVNRQKFFQELLWIAGQRSYRPGWAAFKYKEKFGDWPPRRWQSLPRTEPSDATRAWVRSRMIAFAKARGRAA